MKPKVFQHAGKWYVSFIATNKDANPLTHYTKPRMDIKCLTWEHALAYAGYLASTRRDGFETWYFDFNSCDDKLILG